MAATMTADQGTATEVRLEPLLRLDLGQKIGQLRAIPVRLDGTTRALLAIYCADFEIDPFTEMFFLPTDTLKLALFTPAGEILWRRDLGRGVIPGIWFCPVFAFDLDGDGTDEIWFVNNVNVQHPLGVSGYRLERLDARTGQTTGQWPWPNHGTNAQSLSHLFRNFIFGGHAGSEPVLVTAQGTYGGMFLQAFRPGTAGASGALEPRWEVRIPPDAPGARGSHMCAIADLDGDGVQEVLWGERCIELDRGRELFCADRDHYRGHSDIAQPVYHHASGRRYLYTCRESDPTAQPRVVLFDSRGERVWGDVDHGHMDIGWVARLGLQPSAASPARHAQAAPENPGHPAGPESAEYVAMSIRIGQKTAGPDGRHHQRTEEFAWEAFTGRPVRLPFSAYRTIPVDLNGDGFHEIVRGQPSGDGEVWDRHGHRIGNVGGPVAMASKFMDLPGEQLLSYAPDGPVTIWADRAAHDSPHALRRYALPEYAANQRQTAVGYALITLSAL